MIQRANELTSSAQEAIERTMGVSRRYQTPPTVQLHDLASHTRTATQHSCKYGHNPVVLRFLVLHPTSLTPHQSYTSTVLQPSGPTCHQSYSPVILHLISPTVQQTFGSTVLQPSSPTRQQYYSPVLLLVNSPTAHQSYISIVLQPSSPTTQYF